MTSRAQRVLPVLVALFLVAGSIASFPATGSQAQFTAANALFFALAALLALAGLAMSGNDDSGPARAQVDPFTLTVALSVFWAFATSLVSGRFPSAFFGESTSQTGLASVIALLAVGAYAAREVASARAVMKYLAPGLVVVQGAWALLSPSDIVDATHAGYSNSSALGFALAVLLPWVLWRGATPATESAEAGKPTGQPAKAVADSWSPGMAVRVLVAAFGVFAAYRAEARLALALMLSTIVWFAVDTLAHNAAVKRRVFLAGSLLGAASAGVLVYLERLGRLPFGFLTVRYALWETAFAALARRPLLGYGADGFFSAGAAATGFDPVWGGRPLIFADGTTDPHNVFVFAMACFGVVGGVLLMALVVTWLARAGFGARAFDEFNPAFLSVGAGFVLLLTMPITLDILPVFALTVGLSVARERSTEPAGGAAPRPVVRWILLGLAAVVLAVSAANSATRVGLGAVSYYAPAPLGRAVPAARFWAWDPYFAHQVNASFGGLVLPEEKLSVAKEAWQTAQPSRAIALDRHNPYFALGYAQALWNAGRPAAEVIAAYQSAIGRYPSFPAAHADLALFYAQAGDVDAAQSELQAVYAVGDPAAYPWGGTAALAQKAIDDAK